MSCTTAQQPEFALNLTKLCRVESDNDEPLHRTNATDHSNETTPVTVAVGQARSPNEHTSPEDKMSYLGESWYLSYIFQNTNNEFHHLHRSVERSGDQEGSMSSATLERTRDQAIPGVKQIPTDLPASDLQSDLIDGYFSRFHLYCPIVEQLSFLASVRDGSVSITLLRCVLFIASVHCDIDILHRMGYSTRLNAGDDFFGKANAAFDCDVESDRLTMLICSYLLHYWWGMPTTFKDSLWRLAGVIRSAQCMGMHRSTLNSRMEPEVKSRWKRIWWILYIRDRQTSLSVGTPMVINDLDCDAEELTVDDFPNDSEETILYIMTQATLSRAAGEIFHSYFSPSQRRRTSESRYRIEARQDIQAKLEEWHASVPEAMHYKMEGKGHLALVLQMTYKFYTILFYQRLQRSSPKREIGSEDSCVILEAASTITRLVEDAMIYWDAQYFPMICVTAIFATMTAQFVESFSQNVYKNQILSHKLRLNLLGLTKFEQVYILARWIRSLFASILEAPIELPARKFKQSTHLTGQDDVAQLDSLRRNSRSTTAAEELTGESLPSWGVHETTTSSFSVPCDETLCNRSELAQTFASIPSTPGGTVPVVYPVKGSHDVLMPSMHYNPMQWPSPSSFQFQNFQFLADLGLAGFDGSLWDAPHQSVG